MDTLSNANTPRSQQPEHIKHNRQTHAEKPCAHTHTTVTITPTTPVQFNTPNATRYNQIHLNAPQGNQHSQHATPPTNSRSLERTGNRRSTWERRKVMKCVVKQVRARTKQCIAKQMSKKKQAASTRSPRPYRGGEGGGLCQASTQ